MPDTPQPARSPWRTCAELAGDYAALVSTSSHRCLDLARWCPSFGIGPRKVRPLLPGEVVTIVAAPSVGKTALLQNIIGNCCWPEHVLFYSMELPGALFFERQTALHSGMSAGQVESAARDGALSVRHYPDDSLWICDQSGLALSDIEALFVQWRRDHDNQRPIAIAIDYLGLLAADSTRGRPGSRYERTSDNAEELKRMAKRLDVVVLNACQLHRVASDNPICEQVGLFDARDSGAIEAGADLLLGAWRNPEAIDSEIVLRVNKSRKGASGLELRLGFAGDSMRIWEQARPGDGEFV